MGKNLLHNLKNCSLKLLDLPDSSKDFANSTWRCSTNLPPNFSSTKPWTAYVILSGRKARIIQRRCRASFFFHSYGKITSHEISNWYYTNQIRILSKWIKHDGILEFTWGNFSFSGASASTNLRHLFELFSISLSKFLNSSIADNVLIAPHPTWDMKSTGLVVFGAAGKRRRKSSSGGLISFFINRI